LDSPICYFETSAINYLYDNFSIEEIVEIKKVSDVNTIFTCSTIVFWEILNTSNEEKREALIQFCQYFFDDYVLKSPTELIIEYLEQGCPLEEKRREIKSNCTISQVWSDLHKVKEKTFVINREVLKGHSNYMYELSKSLSKMIKADFDESLYKDQLIYSAIVPIINIIYDSLDFVKEEIRNNNYSEAKTRLYKTSLFFMIAILLFGNGFEQDQYDKFWTDKNITSINDKVNYLFSIDEKAIHRGPLAEMGLMANMQLEYETNRGLFFDCLHSMYIPYADRFFTKDIHFSRYKNELNGQLTEKVFIYE
jgi:hypothetical protein